jgi:hypothetical protein
MNGIKERDRQRKLTPKIAVLCLLLALIAGGFWYNRPVGLDTLVPDMKPEWIDSSLVRFNENQESELRTLHLVSGEPGFDKLLSRLEELRFRRPPTNLVLQAVPSLGNGPSQPKMLEDGDFEFFFIRFTESVPEGQKEAELDFFIDEWSYRDFDQSVTLPLGMFQSKELGQALGRELWDLAQPAPS